MIEVESYIVFLTAVFFTFLYFASRMDNPYEGGYVPYGIFAAASWLILSLLWIFLVATPSFSGATAYGTYAVAMLFGGFGLLIITLIFVDLLNVGKRLREKEMGGWEE